MQDSCSETLQSDLYAAGNDSSPFDGCVTLSTISSTPLDMDQTYKKEVCLDEYHSNHSNSYGKQFGPLPSTQSGNSLPQRPRKSWNLNLFLIDLLKDLTENDIEIIKFLLTGEACREQLQSASRVKIFDLLQKHRYVTDGDILRLQVILACSGNENAINKVHQFAQSTGDVLHFDPPLRDLVSCDSCTGLHIAGADFRLYTPHELDEIHVTVKSMVNANCACRDASDRTHTRLYIPLAYREATYSENDMYFIGAEKTTSNRCQRCRPYVVYCHTGTQTEINIDTVPLMKENIRPQEQLIEESSQTGILQSRLKSYEAELGGIISNCRTATSPISSELYNSAFKETHSVKDLLHNLHSMKKELDIKILQTDDLLQQHERLQSEYEKLFTENDELKVQHEKLATQNDELKVQHEKLATQNDELKVQHEKLATQNDELKVQHEKLATQNDELKVQHEKLATQNDELKVQHEKLATQNDELKVQKTEAELQVVELKRMLDEVQTTVMKRSQEENEIIDKLKNELEMTTASLLNAQNDKRLHELTRLLEQISSMSMTVKKVYGNFDPAHEHISPKQDELFRRAMSGRIGLIYPQIYYKSNQGK